MSSFFSDFKFKMYFSIFLSLAIGIGVPLRVLFPNFFTPLDIAFDLGCLTFACFVYRFQHISHKAGHKNRLHPFQTLMLLVFGFPFFTAAKFILSVNLPILFLLKLVSLSDLTKIKKILHKVDSLHPVIARLTPLAVITPLLVHMLACSWIYLRGFTEPTFANNYVYAVYWVITTLSTVGYGDIAPKTPAQMMFASLTMIIGVAFFGYILSNMASLLSRLDAARESYMNHLDKVESYMRYNKVPVHLRRKVRSYYRYLWENRSGYSDESIVESLPKKLRTEVSFYLKRKIIEAVPMFHGAERDFLEEIVLKLKPLVATPGEILFQEGALGESMYFIQRGHIEINNKHMPKPIILKDGMFFGEMALLNSSRRNAKAIAHDYCDLFTLSREDFDSVLTKYPDFAKLVKEIALERHLLNRRAG